MKVFFFFPQWELCYLVTNFSLKEYCSTWRAMKLHLLKLPKINHVSKIQLF